ncbi:hypothetical protein EV13_1050 [Prochlorococcus sp. MIT 0702]|nr:hypothetical protein EV12_1088 [Prochlorococcus sp. MIT 0701]KGG29583.1 hypothetical protein EV13_1050 [Prochlorococcus sp. MIT 0702]KGG36078.1 hypothetical protein EV14_0485 [Prochlorococcus sp. MIT 0703]
MPPSTNGSRINGRSGLDINGCSYSGCVEMGRQINVIPLPAQQ